MNMIKKIDPKKPNPNSLSNLRLRYSISADDFLFLYSSWSDAGIRNLKLHCSICGAKIMEGQYGANEDQV